MKKRELNIKLRLQQIYKASDCADANDCKIAIEDLKSLIRLNDCKQTPAIRNRMRSLNAKLKQYI